MEDPTYYITFMLAFAVADAADAALDDHQQVAATGAQKHSPHAHQDLQKVLPTPLPGDHRSFIIIKSESKPLPMCMYLS